MVFQSYALYPHMDVAQEHDLRPQVHRRRAGRARPPRRRGRAHAAARASCSAAIRAISPAASASASRSAARSCASRTCSCSTSRCRISTRRCACRHASRSRGCTGCSSATMVYVTHDQIEAMTLADRIVVMNQGRIEQVGKPLDLYYDAGQSLRRRLHRLAGDELLSRRRSSRSRAGEARVTGRRDRRRSCCRRARSRPARS